MLESNQEIKKFFHSIIGQDFDKEEILQHLYKLDLISEDKKPLEKTEIHSIMYELILYSIKLLNFNQVLILIKKLSQIDSLIKNRFWFPGILKKMILKEDNFGERFPIKTPKELKNYMKLINNKQNFFHATYYEILVDAAYSLIFDKIDYYDFWNILKIIINSGGLKEYSEDLQKIIDWDMEFLEPLPFLDILEPTINKDNFWNDSNLFYLIGGAINWETRRKEKALVFFKKMNIESHDESNYLSIALIHIITGKILSELNRIENAIDYYKKALNLYKKYSNPKESAKTYVRIAHEFSDIGNYDESIKYYEKVKEFDIKNGNWQDVARTNIVIGILYLKKGDFNKAIGQNKKALENNKKINNTNEVIKCYYKIIELYEQQKNYESALEQYQELSKIFESSNQYSELAGIHKKMAEICLKLQNPEDAINHYLHTVSNLKKIDDWRGVIHNTKNIADIYESLGNLQKTNEYYKEIVYLYSKAEISSIKELLSFGRLREIDNKLRNIIIKKDIESYITIIEKFNRGLERCTKFDFISSRNIYRELETYLEELLENSEIKGKDFIKSLKTNYISKFSNKLEEILNDFQDDLILKNVHNAILEIYLYRIELAKKNNDLAVFVHLTIAYIERLLEKKLYESYSININNVNWDLLTPTQLKNLENFTKKRSKAYRKREITDEKSLTFNSMVLLLAFLDNKFHSFYRKMEKKLRRLRRVRNRSYLGHEAKMAPKWVLETSKLILNNLNEYLELKEQDKSLLDQQMEGMEKLINFIIYTLN